MRRYYIGDKDGIFYEWAAPIVPVLKNDNTVVETIDSLSNKKLLLNHTHYLVLKISATLSVWQAKRNKKPALVRTVSVSLIFWGRK